MNDQNNKVFVLSDDWASPYTGECGGSVIGVYLNRDDAVEALTKEVREFLANDEPCADKYEVYEDSPTCYDVGVPGEYMLDHYSVKITEAPCTGLAEKEKNRKVKKTEVNLDAGRKLVAEASSDPSYPREIYVYLSEDGVVTQDIAIIRNSYSLDGNTDGANYGEDIEALVYADKDNEDYTHKFKIGIYKDPDENNS